MLFQERMQKKRLGLNIILKEDRRMELCLSVTLCFVTTPCPSIDPSFVKSCESRKFHFK